MSVYNRSISPVTSINDVSPYYAVSRPYRSSMMVIIDNSLPIVSIGSVVSFNSMRPVRSRVYNRYLWSIYHTMWFYHPMAAIASCCSKSAQTGNYKDNAFRNHNYFLQCTNLLQSSCQSDYKNFRARLLISIKIFSGDFRLIIISTLESFIEQQKTHSYLQARRSGPIWLLSHGRSRNWSKKLAFFWSSGKNSRCVGSLGRQWRILVFGLYFKTSFVLSH